MPPVFISLTIKSSFFDEIDILNLSIITISENITIITLIVLLRRVNKLVV